ncbi:hypothetical protein [Paenibacillus sp. R14(2021)]|uniref:hypothetical protein n=1 Tax=Paenibacillus sp. R14(2021) TaxID=2859228 RepID=UPI001C616A50|nr:hypothetical protein [Paenibacillus sp. R14(2021)]
MGEQLKKAILVIFYSAGSGIMLFLFTVVKNVSNLLFSLLAIVIAVHFFKRSSSTRSRVVFIVLAVLYFLICVLIHAMITAAKTASH